MDYAVIFEKTFTGWSAYAPDLPGLGVAGPTYEATEQLIREGINFHIEGLRADGDPISRTNHPRGPHAHLCLN